MVNWPNGSILLRILHASHDTPSLKFCDVKDTPRNLEKTTFLDVFTNTQTRIWSSSSFDGSPLFWHDSEKKKSLQVFILNDPVAGALLLTMHSYQSCDNILKLFFTRVWLNYCGDNMKCSYKVVVLPPVFLWHYFWFCGFFVCFCFVLILILVWWF